MAGQGATPEKLACSMFRRIGPLRSEAGTRRKPVAGGQIVVKEMWIDQSGDRVLHLHKRS